MYADSANLIRRGVCAKGEDRMKKRIVSMCLALLMAASLLPLEVTAAWAAETRQLTAASAQAAYSTGALGPGARNLEELELAAYENLYAAIVDIAWGRRQSAEIDCGYVLTQAQRDRVWAALQTDTTWELYWCMASEPPMDYTEMNMWRFIVKSQYRVDSNEAYLTNISRIYSVPGAPTRGAASGTDYEKLLANISTVQNKMSGFLGSEARALQYLGGITDWNGEVEIYQGSGNWNVVNFHGRNYIVDIASGNCVLRGREKTGSRYAFDGSDYAKVYSSKQMTLQYEDYSPYPDTIVLRGAAAGSDGITVTWRTDPVAETYLVYRRSSPSGVWTSLTSTAVDGQYLDTTAQPDTTYYYTVVGANGQYTSLSKDETGVSAAMPSAVPADVTLTGAAAGDGCIKVTWKAAQGAATYKVYRMGPGDTKWKGVATGISGTSYTDTSIKGGARYTYTVRGISPDGQQMSKGYNKTGVSAIAPTAPATVKLVSAEAGGSGIVVKWETALNAATYRVYRKAPGDTGWKIIARNAKGTSYTDKNVEPGAKYTYTVRGVDSNGSTLSKSYNASGVSEVVPPADVALSRAAASGTSITVTWKKTAGAATYRVYRKGPDDTGWKIIARNAKGTSYTDKNVEPGGKYTYTVRGVASSDGVLSRSYNSGGVSAVVPPANVTLSKASVSGTSIVVTWQAAAGAATYRVYRKGPGDTGWKIIAQNAKGTSYTDSSVTPGAKYIYTVRGVASDGKTLSKGYNSKGVENTVPKTPATVTLSKAEAAGTSVTVTWKTTAGAATYRVYRKGPGDTGWKIIARNAKGTSYKDTNVVSGAKYTYTVRGVASNGSTLSKSYNSSGVSAVVPPADVTLVGASAGVGGITVTWKKAAGAAAYRVYRKEPGGDWTTIASKCSGTSYKDAAAEPGVKYIYTVRGLASDGKTRSSSYNPGVSAVMLPADVKGLDTIVDSSAIIITWEAAAGAASYNVYRRTTDNTAWTLVGNKLTATRYRDTDITDGTVYTYTVRGVASDGTTLSAGTDTISATAAYTGTCGRNLTWCLHVVSGELVVSGTGDACVMDDYSAAFPAPWYQQRQLIRSVTVTAPDAASLSIGANAFADCAALTSVTLPGGLRGLGSGVFSGCTALTDVYYDNDLHAWEQISGSADALPAGAKLRVKDDLYESGTLSDGTVWELATVGFLDIRGKGPMSDLPAGTRTTDWYPYRDRIEVIAVTGVSSIGANAFRDCPALERVSITAGVTAVGAHAFANCPALRKILYSGKGAAWTAATAGVDTGIPSTAVIQYRDNEYDSGTCGDDLSWLLDAAGTLTISGTGAMTDFSLRWAADGYTPVSTAPWTAHAAFIRRIVLEEGVTSVGDFAFMGCTEAADVTLPASVAKLGKQAFGGCTGLTSIALPDSLTAISGSLFEGCTGLTAITLPTGVTSIGSSAFSGCASLTEMTVPGSVTSIGSSAFSDCTSLAEVTIPDSVTSIGIVAFSGCTSLTSVRLPRGLTTLASHMFSRCGALTSVDLPEGLTEIGSSAFSNCTALTAIRLPAALRTVGASAFNNCIALTAVTLPDSVASVGGAAFQYCSALTSLEMAGSAAIGQRAFAGCTALSEVSLTGRGTSLEKDVFAGCTALTRLSITGAGSSVAAGAMQRCTSLTTVDLSGVTAIGDSAFAGCTSLTTAELSRVDTVGASAFADCTALTAADLSDAAAVGDSAFEGCTALTAVQLPNAAAIGTRAFYGCTALADVTFPTVSTDIGGAAFMGCTSLTEARITSYSLTLGKSAFSDSGLQWIVITGGITDIGSWTFSGCPLRVMYIPDGVTSIDYQAFYNCDALRSVFIPASVTSIDASAFAGTGDSIRVFYSGDRDAWRALTANQTSGRLKNAVITYGYGRLSTSEIDGAGSCGPYVMGEYNKVQWRYAADGTLTIRGSGPMGDFRRMSGSSGSEWYTRPWTFYMPAVRRVVVEEGVTSVGACAFCDDSGQLTAVQLPESLTAIGQGAFGNCTALTRVFYKGSETQWNSIRIGIDNESLEGKVTYNATSYDD